jgi:hypothetical protein
MESMLAAWIKNQVKALSLFEELKKDFPHEANLEFTTSTGWFNRFKNRQQLHNIKFTRELVGSDALSAKQFPGILKKK